MSCAEIVPFITNGSSVSVKHGTVGTGTVGIGFNFSLNTKIIEETNMSSDILYSAFTGEDVGSQIRGNQKKIGCAS